MNSVKLIFVLICNALFIMTVASNESINITDLRRCRLTHKGLHYTGIIAKTAGGIRCQYWETNTPVHKVSDNITDELFPEGSKKSAKNYCRNPTHSVAGPWCYTLDPQLSDDQCDIPLCHFPDCRLSGPGVEYGGKAKKSGTDQDCLEWDYDDRPALYPDTWFSDRSRKKAKSRCRNPTGDPGGPWCFVDSEEEGAKDEDETKSYCDIPFCDERECLVYTEISKKVQNHSLFTSLNSTDHSIHFGVKLWDPDKWSSAFASLSLTVLSSPGTSQHLHNWGAGVVIQISNVRTGLTAGYKINKDEDEEERFVTTPMLMSGSNWTWLWVSWGGGYFTLGLEGESTPLFIGEYEEENNLLSLTPGEFMYYNIGGDGVLWSLPFCEAQCEIHTTTQLNFHQFWRMKKSTTGYDISFYIRAVHKACIELRVTPSIQYPSIQIIVGAKDHIQVTLQKKSSSIPILLKEVKAPNIISYWKWSELAVSTLGPRLFIFWTVDTGTHTILEVEHNSIWAFRWFSIASKDTTAHWTLFCKTDFPLPEPLPPECAASVSEYGYLGTQWISKTGKACIPWKDSENIPKKYHKDKLYLDGNQMKARNYCRNLDKDPKGPFCYTGHNQKSYCKPRTCLTSQCRMAGTGNDFMGKLNTTRSNRTCQKWESNSPHKVDSKYLNETLYPDAEIADASNYCRDPSRNIAGTWCYTTDPNVVFDLCYVPICGKEEKCIILTKGSGLGRYVYILPQWRKQGLHFSLKEWDPDLTDGIIFRILPEKENVYYQLSIGANDNEKVILAYNNGTGEYIMKERSLPHLIPIGKWAGFWLKTTTDSVELGYEGVENPLFEWTNPNRESTFNPKFITYSSLIGYTIGVSFKCNECHVENTSIPDLTRIYPISLWSDKPGKNPDRLTIYVRGTGQVEVSLLNMIGTSDYYGVVIGFDDNKDKMVWAKHTSGISTPIGGARSKLPLIEADKWKKYTIIFIGSTVYIEKDDELIYEQSNPHQLLFYFFGLAVKRGYALWSANCKPGDIDPPVRNGGWSDWSELVCSVTCGGGVGIETRTCTNPEPNVLGNDCIGSDTRKGPCNIFPCGEVSPDTQELLKHRLKTQHFNKIIMENDDVILENNQEILDKVKKESPNCEINWTHNGNYLDTEEEENEQERIKVTEYKVIVKRAMPRDSGVYVCMIVTPNDIRLVLQIISVTVQPKTYSRENREGRYHSQLCNSLVLGYIYDNLEQRWELNGRVYKNYGITTPMAVNELRIRKLKKSHEGDWKCIVIQRELKFIWITNWIRLKVKPPPTFLTYLMEDPLPGKFFKHFGNEKAVLAFLIAILLLTVILVSLGIVIYLKYFRLN